MNLTVFKIRRNSDGLFSTGGTNPSFTKKGKQWSQKNHLTSHLGLVSSKKIYNDCEVVVYEIVESPENPPVPVNVYLDEIHLRHDEQERVRQQRIDEIRQSERYRQYKKLKKEFE